MCNSISPPFSTYYGDYDQGAEPAYDEVHDKIQYAQREEIGYHQHDACVEREETDEEGKDVDPQCKKHYVQQERK
jgi:hypothetical protein